jgi:hypothetical protein
MMKRLGWDKTHCIFGDDGWGRAFYEGFKIEAEIGGIELVTPENLRKIPFETDWEGFKNYDENLLSIANSDVVPVMLIGYAHFNDCSKLHTFRVFVVQN